LPPPGNILHPTFRDKKSIPHPHKDLHNETHIWYYMCITMQGNQDNVVIQEPPLQELNKKRSCLKRTCFTGCGCIVIFLIASLLILKFAAGPKRKEIKEVPNYILEHIPLYDVDAIDSIKVTSGKDRNKGLELVAYIPKLILAPIIIAIENNTQPNQSDETSTWSEISTFVKEPLTDQRDAITIEWSFLTAEPSFVHQFYVQELEKKNIEITENTRGRKIKQLRFENDVLAGSLQIQDDPNTPGTDYVVLDFFTP